MDIVRAVASPLSERIAELEAALEPFAACGASLSIATNDVRPWPDLALTVGDFKRARAALARRREDEP